MNKVNKLIVSINLEDRERDLGELIQAENKIYFKYFKEFIDTGIEISPFKMALSEKILSAKLHPFDGLFGVFNDSLPDGWGRLLLDRKLSSEGISLHQIGPLDRLAYVGSKGVGALIYRPMAETVLLKESVLELDVLANDMNQVLKGTSTVVLDKLFQLGGSSGGARPKLFAGYNSYTDQLIPGTTDLPEGYEHWIIKFPSSSDPFDIANIEYAYYKMALDAGIEMNESRLFKGLSGREYFGTKRFDRVNNQQLHMHSASGLLHDNFRLSNLDYGHLMDCAFQLENHIEAYTKILRLAAFNVYGHNRDDHSKNFSFLMDSGGLWKLAPAYDLTFSSSSYGMHSTMVAGESKMPGRKHLLELAQNFSVKNPNKIIDRVQDVLLSWKKYAIECGVSKESTTLINKTIQNYKY